MYRALPANECRPTSRALDASFGELMTGSVPRKQKHQFVARELKKKKMPIEQ